MDHQGKLFFQRLTGQSSDSEQFRLKHWIYLENAKHTQEWRNSNEFNIF